MSNEPVQDTRSTADQAPAPLPYAGAIRWLGAGGAILALLCLLTGVAMLVMAALILSVMRRNKA